MTSEKMHPRALMTWPSVTSLGELEKKNSFFWVNLAYSKSPGWTLDSICLHSWACLSSEQPIQLPVEALLGPCPDQIQLYLWGWLLGTCS